jgi:hypothetical protein
MTMIHRTTDKRPIRYHESVFTPLVVRMLIADCLLLSAIRATDISILPTIPFLSQYELYVMKQVFSPSWARSEVTGIRFEVIVTCLDMYEHQLAVRLLHQTIYSHDAIAIDRPVSRNRIGNS